MKNATSSNLPSRDEMMKAYEQLKSVDIKNVKEHAQRMADALVLLSKIASSTSPEEFAAVITQNELPAIKLSPQEMEVIQGGWLGMFLRIFGSGWGWDVFGSSGDGGYA